MNEKYTMITDIAFLNSEAKSDEDFHRLFSNHLFTDESKWDNFKLSDEIDGMMDKINARMKYYMSKMALGIYNVLDDGPGKNIEEDDEIYLFSGFPEIGTVSKIGNIIMTDDYSINPAIFPNSVHHISLCYYAILKKISNYCATITDGLSTKFSFINFIKNRVKIKENFIVVTAEENAAFFEYEIEKVLNIVPSFASYKVVPNSDKGFIFRGVVESIDDLRSLEIYKNARSIFVDKATYFILKKVDKDKDVYCESPIVKDNPCGIIFRLAFPFYFSIKGISIVVEKIGDKYFYFEVNI